MRFTFHNDFEMFVRMTDKQTKREGSSRALAIHLVLPLHPHCQDMTVVDFSTGKIFFCQFLESNPTDEILDAHYSRR